MHIILLVVLGFVIGGVVAATGIGGGVLLMPALILILHVSPFDAVGTALLFMCITKIWATLLHWKQATVDFRLAGYLAIGSLPGALIGSELLRVTHLSLGQRMDHLLRIAIAISLILVASLSLVTDFLKNRRSLALGTNPKLEREGLRNAIWIGLAGGLLVSLTSVGSGSLIIILLLVFCPRPPVILVGTDIFHGLILSSVAALAHLGIGHTDLRLVGLLVLGSIGGVLLGTRIAVALASVWLRRTLLILAAAGGAAML